MDNDDVPQEEELNAAISGFVGEKKYLDYDEYMVVYSFSTLIITLISGHLLKLFCINEKAI